MPRQVNNISKLITLRLTLALVMLCAFSGAAFAQLTATFKNYNGTVLQTVKVKRGTAPKYTGATPTRAADAQYTYTFKGWSPTVGVITTNTTYTAQFTATVRKYTITFLNGDGSTLQSSALAYGATPSCSSTPTKAATAQYTYTFKAWSPAIAKVTGAATYTPTFNQTVRSYAIKFVDGDGKTVQSSTLQYGATPSYTGSTPTKTATAQYTYTFKAWSPTIAKVTGAATYTATFNQTVRSYTITFKNGSTTLQAKIFNYGATPTYSGSKPTKAPSGEDTFVFTGWSPTITKVTGAKTYSAVFAKGTYDACGNAYGYVKIGDYTWLAENMRCNKYDTKSERAGATISTSTSAVFSPYYTDARDKSLWSNKSKTTGAGLSDAQVSKLGYLYNWAAAVALPTEAAAKAQTSAFSTIRQGICPNGYHVPSSNEWYSFRDYLGNESSLKLRTTTGWAFDDDRVKAGYDTYGFGCLPSGQSEGNIIYYVGTWTYYWTSTPLVLDFRPVEVANYIYVWNIYSYYSGAPYNAEHKDVGFSVRCLKDHQYTIKFVNYDGTVLQSLTVTESYTPSYTGSTPTRAADAQYTYTFKGWDSTISAATADKTYTATYNKTTRSYTIRFMNGTTVLESKSVAYGTKPTYTKATPTKASTAQYSYTFSGWSPTIASVTKAQDYTAQFSSTVNKYTIKFLNGNGSTLQSSSWAYGATPSCSSTPTKASTSQYSYTFKAWSPAIAKVTGDATYTPTFDQTIRKYIITFANYDGTVLQSSEWEYGTTPSYSGTTPTRPDDDRFSDYVFEGWNSSITSVTGTKTYTAKFSGTLKPFDAPENEHSLVVIPDICGNKYNVVKIGSQLWLAENMRCTKYDTKSERAGVVIPHGGSSGINPYFQAYLLASGNATTYAGNLSTSQIPYLGLFYSWSAAVGLTGEQAQAQTTGFDGDRQGICPNGWHIPVMEEWEELVNYIEVTDGKGEGTAGLHLKTTSGWYNDKNGTDTYGFSALPADRGTTTDTYGVGGWAKYWTPTAKSASSAYACQVKYGTDAFLYSADEAGVKSRDALCVRCVRAFEDFEIRFVNYDGTELQSSKVDFGSLPEYKGDTPVRDADAQYTYTFSGWDSEIKAVTDTKTYKAQFKKNLKPFDAPENEHSIDIVTDICGNKYNVVKIGSQLWLAENMRCNKYDTESEKAGQSFSTSASAIYAPYYTGCFTEGANVTISPNNTFTDEQWDYLGLLYNWAAALGLSEGESRAQTREFNTPRQGICPNGYHVPSDAEWLQLIDYIENTDGKGEGTAAKHLKATSGWAPNSNNGNGLDTYGFSLLPVDRGIGKTIYGIGTFAKFTTASAKSNTFADYMNVDGDALVIVGNVGYTSAKSHIYTVRCVREAEKFEIKFENYDGEELQSSEVEYGSIPVYEGNTPVKQASAQYSYVFSGWSPEVVMVTGAATYTAQYDNEVNKYVVRFLNDDGTELQSSELDYGATPAYTGETPTKEATAQYTYTFAGWDSEITEVTGAKDYTATYTPTTNKYVVRFLNEDGTELQSSELEYGATPEYKGETPTKDATSQYTYTFAGWDSEIADVTGAKDYTATYTPSTNKYVVRFLNDDGTELQSEELDYGATPEYKGETPTKDATAQYTYTFKGWDSEIAEVTGAKDYTATYTPTTNKYLITFENYDGEELQSGEVEFGQTPSYEGTTPVKPADAESTYTFSGWSPNITAVTGAQTYTAVFTKVLNTYTVTAEVTGDGGTVSGGGTYSYGTEVTLTATPKHGYHVSKWSTGETSAEIKITVTEDMAFTVSFIHQTADNTPECANAPAVAKYDWLLMLNANAIKDMGYNLNENIVDWYRVVGEMDNLDSGERDDEKVGTGYYYTINSKLNDSGDYYALIDLPWQTTEVGCSGLMRTVVFHYAPKGTTKRAMAVSPTITYPEQQIEIVNLPKEEVEVYVYDVAGRLYRSFRTDGEPAAAFKAEPMAGTYIVVVWTSKGKETFKYIVRKR